MKIRTTVNRAALTGMPTFGRTNGRAFGGTRTDIKAKNIIAYNWRQYRNRRRPQDGTVMPFHFTIISAVRTKKGTHTQPIIGFVTAADRKRAMTFLHSSSGCGFNYFVPFTDVSAMFALQYGIADWVIAGEYYIEGGKGRR